jgi:hypothetical protein
MKKKTLNLKIVELDNLISNQIDISLMPCPCSFNIQCSSKVVGDIAISIFGDALFGGHSFQSAYEAMHEAFVNPGQVRMAILQNQDNLGELCTTQADFDAINAEIDNAGNGSGK